MKAFLVCNHDRTQQFTLELDRHHQQLAAAQYPACLPGIVDHGMRHIRQVIDYRLVAAESAQLFGFGFLHVETLSNVHARRCRNRTVFRVVEKHHGPVYIEHRNRSKQQFPGQLVHVQVTRNSQPYILKSFHFERFQPGLESGILDRLDQAQTGQTECGLSGSKLEQDQLFAARIDRPGALAQHNHPVKLPAHAQREDQVGMDAFKGCFI